MAGVVRITEYAEIATDANGNFIQAGLEPAIAIQSVASSGTSAPSAAFSGATKFIRLDVTTRCFMLVGENPTATNAHTPLEANTPEFFGVKDGMKLAVIE